MPSISSLVLGRLTVLDQVLFILIAIFNYLINVLVLFYTIHSTDKNINVDGFIIRHGNREKTNRS